MKKHTATEALKMAGGMPTETKKEVWLTKVQAEHLMKLAKVETLNRPNADNVLVYSEIKAAGDITDGDTFIGGWGLEVMPNGAGRLVIIRTGEIEDDGLSERHAVDDLGEDEDPYTEAEQYSVDEDPEELDMELEGGAATKGEVGECGMCTEPTEPESDYCLLCDPVYEGPSMSDQVHIVLDRIIHNTVPDGREEAYYEHLRENYQYLEDPYDESKAVDLLDLHLEEDEVEEEDI